MQILNDLYDTLLKDVPTGAVRLDARSLPSRLALLLINRLLGADFLIFDEPELTRAGDTVRLGGRVTILGIERCKAVAAFAEINASLAVTITLSPSLGWAFPQSFPALARTPFEKLVLVEPQLLLATHNASGVEQTARDGLMFEGAVAIGGIIPELGPFLGRLANLVLRGPIRIARPAVSVAIDAAETHSLTQLTASDAPLELLLSAPLPLNLNMPGVALSDAVLVIEGPVISGWSPYPDIRRGVRAKFAIAGKQIVVYCAIGASGYLSVRATPQDLNLPNFAALADLIPDTNVSEFLPEGFGDLSGFRISKLDFDINTRSRELAFVGLGLSHDSSWGSGGGAVSLANPAAYLMVSNPTSKARQVRALFGGKLSVNGLEVFVEAVAPNFIFEAQISDMPLRQFISTQFPELADISGTLPDITLSDIAVSIAPKTGEMAFRAECTGTTVGEDDAPNEATWTLPIGIAPIAVRELTVEFNRRPGARGSKAKVDGLITGRIEIAGASFAVEYAFPGDFVLRGQIPEISFSPLLQAIAGSGVFRDLPLPASMLDLSLTDAYVAIAPQRRSFSIAADTAIGEVEIVLQKTSNGSWGCAMGIAPRQGWKLSGLSSELAVLDGLGLDKTTLIVASSNDNSLQLSTITPSRPDIRLHRDQIASAPLRPIDVRVHRGLNVFSTISLKGTGADEVLKADNIAVYAAVGTRLSDIALEARLDGEYALAANVSMGNVGFRLIPSPTNFSITLLCEVKVGVGSDQLKFIGGLEVQPRGASIKQTMLGTWSSAFDVPGLDISDVALDLGLSFSPPLPVIGVAGTLTVGEVTGSAAVRFDPRDPGRSMLALKFNRLFLIDIVTTFAGTQLTSDISPQVRGFLASIGMEDVEVYIVPTPTTIGELVFEQGLSAGGRLVLQEFEADIRIKIDPSGGMSASGAMTPLGVAGLFSISGNRPGTGPSLNFDLRAGQPFVLEVDGRAELLGISANALINVSETGFVFEISGPVFGIFHGTVKARGGRLGSASGFMLSVRMKNDLLTYLAENASQAIQSAVNAANQQLTAAQNALAAEQRKLASFDSAIENARTRVRQRNAANLNTAMSEVIKWRAEVNRLDVVISQQRAAAAIAQRNAQSGITDASNKVDAAQREVDKLQTQISDQKRWISTLQNQIEDKKRWVNAGNILEKIDRGFQFVGFSAAKEAEIGFAYTKIGAFETARGAAWLGLQTAVGVLSIARNSSNTILNDLNLAIQGPLGAQKTAQFSLDQANKVLLGVQHLTTNELVDLDPSVSVLLAPRAAAWLALETADQYLELCKKTNSAFADIGTFIIKNGLNSLIDIRSVGFECNLVDGHGGAVELDITVGFMRQAPQTFRLSFNFHDPKAGAVELAKRLQPS